MSKVWWNLWTSCCRRSGSILLTFAHNLNLTIILKFKKMQLKLLFQNGFEDTCKRSAPIWSVNYLDLVLTENWNVQNLMEVVNLVMIIQNVDLLWKSIRSGTISPIFITQVNFEQNRNLPSFISDQIFRHFWLSHITKKLNRYVMKDFIMEWLNFASIHHFTEAGAILRLILL